MDLVGKDLNGTRTSIILSLLLVEHLTFDFFFFMKIRGNTILNNLRPIRWPSTLNTLASRYLEISRFFIFEELIAVGKWQPCGRKPIRLHVDFTYFVHFLLNFLCFSWFRPDIFDSCRRNFISGLYDNKRKDQE